MATLKKLLNIPISDSWFQAALLLLYAGLMLFGVVHHEAWVDEPSPWLMTKDISLTDLLFGSYTHNLGHTVLWYLILMPFAKAGLSYETIYAINGVFALAVAWLFLKHAPFSRITKTLWLFSVLIAYQYAVVARPYSLTLLLLFMVALCYPRRFDRSWRYAAAVFLLFEAHVLVFIVPCILTGVYAWELWKRGEWRRYLPPLLLMILGGIVAFAQLTPPQNMEHGMGGILNGATAGNFLYGLSNGWTPYALVHFVSTPVLALAVFLIPCVIVALMVGVMERSTIMVGLFLMATLWFAFVMIFKFRGDFWHHGLMVQMTLFVIWIASCHGISPLRRGIFHGLVTATLAYGCVLTPFFYYMEYCHPYSASRGAAEFLKRSDLTDHMILTEQETMAAYLPETACIWSPNAPYCHTYGQWDSALYRYRKLYQDILMHSSPLLVEATRTFRKLDGKVIVLLRPADAAERESYRLVLIYSNYSFQTGVDENAFVYVTQDTLKDIALQLKPVS